MLPAPFARPSGRTRDHLGIVVRAATPQSAARHRTGRRYETQRRTRAYAGTRTYTGARGIKLSTKPCSHSRTLLPREGRDERFGVGFGW